MTNVAHVLWLNVEKNVKKNSYERFGRALSNFNMDYIIRITL